MWVRMVNTRFNQYRDAIMLRYRVDLIVLYFVRALEDLGVGRCTRRADDRLRERADLRYATCAAYLNHQEDLSVTTRVRFYIVTDLTTSSFCVDERSNKPTFSYKTYPCIRSKLDVYCRLQALRRSMNPHISIPRQHGGSSSFGSTAPSRGEGLRMPRFFKR